MLDEHQLLAAKPHLGDTVTVRIQNGSAQSVSGEILRIEPVAAKRSGFEGLSQLVGGDILIDPKTRMTMKPMTIVEVSLEEMDGFVPYSTTAKIRLGRPYLSSGQYLYKKLQTFYNKLFTE